MKKVVVLGVDFDKNYVDLSEQKTELCGYGENIAHVGI